MTTNRNASDAEKDVANNDDNGNSMQQLENALIICGFGKFHILLMFASFSAMFVYVAITTSMSNILPSAECDLSMGIIEKGMLNAIPYIGQGATALFIGFVTDTFGRRMFLFGGHLGIFCSNLLQALSHSYWVLLIGKLIEGVLLSVCFNTTSVMVSECTHKNVRDRTLVIWSSFMAVGYFMQALIAWAILPQQWDIKSYVELHSWNFYILSFTIWSLLAAIVYYYLPESPKFLLSQGREDEALDVIKTIYSMNTGKDKNTFPIASLSSNATTGTKNTSLKKQLVVALFETKSLFRKPLFTRLYLIMIINLIGMLGLTALNLWYPQISTMIDTYRQEHGDSGQFCKMIDDYNKNHINTTLSNNNTHYIICTPRVFGFETYMLGIFIGSISIFCYIINVYLVNILGQRLLMFLLIALSGFSSGAIYWTSTLMTVAVFFAITCASMLTALGLLYSVLVRVFPTPLRALAFAFVMIAGRVGNIIGSIFFPIMLQAACVGPFIFLFASSIFAAILVYFLPSPAKEDKNCDS